jgi:hypothetical protein
MTLDSPGVAIRSNSLCWAGRRGSNGRNKFTQRSRLSITLRSPLLYGAYRSEIVFLIPLQYEVGAQMAVIVGDIPGLLQLLVFAQSFGGWIFSFSRRRAFSYVT